MDRSQWVFRAVLVVVLVVAAALAGVDWWLSAVVVVVTVVATGMVADRLENSREHKNQNEVVD